MFIKLHLIFIIICIIIIIVLRLSCKCTNVIKPFTIDHMNNIPLYLDSPTKMIKIYFPYININYINSKIIQPASNICVRRYSKLSEKTVYIDKAKIYSRTRREPVYYTSTTSSDIKKNLATFDTWIQMIPNYETELFNILINKKYDNIYKAIFDIKPEYKKLFNIFNAYIINRKNSTLIKDTDVQNKYIIKKLYNDNDYLYIVPFTETIKNSQDIPIISNFSMIDSICKKHNKYIQCKIKITPEPKNFQIIEDKYYQDIIDYYTSIIFVDIIKKIPSEDKCNIIIPIEEERQKKFKDKLKTTFIDVSIGIDTTTSMVTTCNCGKL